MKANILISMSLFFLATGCAKQDNQTLTNLQNPTGIIGGEAATSDSPVTSSTVAIIYDLSGTPYNLCTGTLISKNLVLTASHCLLDQEISDLSIYFGETLPKNFRSSNFRKIKSVVQHPGYEMTKDPIENVETGVNDIGLIMLETEAPVTAKPVPVLNDTVLKVGQELLLAGYGLLNETTVPPVRAKGLNFTKVSIAKTFANIIVTDQSDGKGACAGDSGGPAFLESEKGLIVLGITRGPYNSAEDCRHWGEYTYASRYKEYIIEVSRAMGAIAPVFVNFPAPTAPLTPPPPSAPPAPRGF